MVLAADILPSTSVNGLSGLDSLLLLVQIASLPFGSWFMKYLLCCPGRYKVNAGTRRNLVTSS